MIFKIMHCTYEKGGRTCRFPDLKPLKQLKIEMRLFFGLEEVLYFLRLEKKSHFSLKIHNSLKINGKQLELGSRKYTKYFSVTLTQGVFQFLIVKVMFPESLNYSSETCKMTLRKIGKQLELGSRSTSTYHDPNFFATFCLKL